MKKINFGQAMPKQVGRKERSIRSKWLTWGRRTAALVLVPVVAIGSGAGIAYALTTSNVSGKLTFNGNPAIRTSGDQFVCVIHAVTGESGSCDTNGGTNGAYAIANVSDGDYGYNLYKSAGHVGGLNSGANGQPDTYSLSTYETVVNVNGADKTHDLGFTTSKVTVTAVDIYGNPVSNAGFVNIRQVDSVPAAPVQDNNGHAYTLNNLDDYDQINSSGVATSSVFTGTTYSICLSNVPNQTGSYCAPSTVVNGDITVQIVTTPIATNLFSSNPTQYPNLSWSGGASDGTFDVYRDGAAIGTSATRNYNDTTAPEGNHTYQVLARASNGVASSSLSNSKDVTVDRTAPTVISTAWSANPVALGNSSTLTIGSDESLGTGEYFVDNDPGVGNGTPMNSNGTATFGANLGVGVYTIGIRVTDPAGNWSSTANSLLVVYDPTAPTSINGKNKKDLVPSLLNGDVLPGLISSSQSDKADYGMTVSSTNGTIDPKSDFSFNYVTGTNCKKNTATNCHSFSLTTSSVAWLSIGATNSSQGQFLGTATVTVDGVSTTNQYIVTGVDGGRLNPSSNDSFALKVFASGANPSTNSPIYKASGSLASTSSVSIK